MEPRTISPELRSGKNTTGATLPQGRIVVVKVNPTVTDEVAVATAPTQPLYGVVAEPIFNGEWGNIVVEGRVPILAGAAIGAGVRVTTDASGSAVPAASGDVFIAISTTAGSAGSLFEAELQGPGGSRTP